MQRSSPQVRPRVSPAVVLALFVSLGSIALAVTARAQVPSPANCTVPLGITLVATGPGGAVLDPLGTFTVVVRDAANAPIAGAGVLFRFGCSGVKPASAPLSPGAVVVACGVPETHVIAVTDAQGRATLEVGGAVRKHFTLGGPCVKVEANGVPIGGTQVAVFDLEGGDGLTINDVSVWLKLFGLGTYTTQADFNFSGTLDIGDLSVLLGAMGTGNSSVRCGTYCP